MGPRAGMCIHGRAPGDTHIHRCTPDDTHIHRQMQTDLQSSPSAGGVLSANTRSGSLLRDDSVEPVCVAALSMATVKISSVSVVVVDSLALVSG